MAYFNNYANPALTNELMSDLWIQRNIPGGLESPYGRALDNFYGGNPNPTLGQVYNSRGFGYGLPYGYPYRR